MSDAAITQLSANEPRDSEATQASSGWVPATAKSSRAAQGEAPVNQVIEKATRKFQDALLPVNSHLHLEVNAVTHTVTVKIINDQSGEVIRQIPSEELMGLAVSMENGEGALVNRRI